ncbi:MAG: DUF488 domain-containing protein [Chloroflexi bacterium]|nr:DUF488 domain-containing protein [Chloroflexota bacterium]
MEIYTIGHSRHEWEMFLALLKTHGIETLVDVRSKPVSRFARFANKRVLPHLLEREGIRHAYLGDSLGGKPADESYYDAKGSPNYERIASEPGFKKGIDELLKLAKNSRVAIMCAEEDPTKCHRRLLIGPSLTERGVELLHIRKDGSVQAEREFTGSQGELL